MKVIFVFIDGLGLGENDPLKNPLAATQTPGLDFIFQNYEVIPTDTRLGVEGLPQSATGQTAIFTGVNGSVVLGRHLSGQPTETLIEIINKTNLFKTLLEKGFTVTYANVYRDPYLKEMHNPSNRKNRPSVTSVMGMSVDMEFRTVRDYEEGNGVYHDITGQILKESGYDAQLLTPKEAAERLYRISRQYDFTLYEHFMTDIIGHKGDMNLAVEEIELLDAFLEGLVKVANLEEDLIVITSDHGNIEDVTVKTHTMNKVPTVFIGKLPDGVEPQVESILDVGAAVVEVLCAARRQKG